MIDLNPEDDLNTLTLEARKEIWIPQVVFAYQIPTTSAIVKKKKKDEEQLPLQTSILCILYY